MLRSNPRENDSIKKSDPPRLSTKKIFLSRQPWWLSHYCFSKGREILPTSFSLSSFFFLLIFFSFSTVPNNRQPFSCTRIKGIPELRQSWWLSHYCFSKGREISATLFPLFLFSWFLSFSTVPNNRQPFSCTRIKATMMAFALLFFKKP